MNIRVAAVENPEGPAGNAILGFRATGSRVSDLTLAGLGVQDTDCRDLPFLCLFHVGPATPSNSPNPASMSF